MTSKKSPRLLDSFNFAFEGIVHTLRAERNMRLHFLIAATVMTLAIVADVSKIELIALLISITFVLITEMINTAIEAAVDLSTTEIHPLAKLAKDIAAGAVLIAAINALAVGYLVFSGKTANRAAKAIDHVRDVPSELAIVAFVLTVIAVIAVKALTGSGTALRGGMPSGHAAVAFAGWIVVTYVAGEDHRFLASAVVLILALLVAQTRLEAGVHTTWELVAGALLGALLTMAIFQLAGV